ncbi:MAG: hypothetical protein MJZ99_08015 [Bacteroidales bacterium]|nr:hypothetical protein [Candidatus Colimorpha merdihippi]MCQ2282554.1 hypothetical protein [Bacteroidales bacterium]
MKKAIYTAVLLVLVGIGTMSQAQNCYKIVEPYFDYNEINPAEYPAEKYEWRCHFSYSCFYMTDTLPQNATVFSITQLVDLNTQEALPDHFVPNLEVFSYWAYPFAVFQKDAQQQTIYFDTHNATNRYLAVRSWNQASQYMEEHFKSDDK